MALNEGKEEKEAEDVKLTAKMQAVVKKITVGKHSRYILLDYIKL